MDVRFDRALFRPVEAAAWLGIRPARMRDWFDIATRFEGVDKGAPSIPFAGFVEGRVIRDLRNAGLQLREIREANERLKDRTGREHPLIHRSLAHDGRSIFAQVASDWMRARDEQLGLPEVIEYGLEKVADWADDDYPNRIRVDVYGGCEVIIDPRLAGGHPVLDAVGARVEDVLGLVLAGDPIDVAAEEFGLTPGEVQALVLADYRRGTRAAA